MDIMFTNIKYRWNYVYSDGQVYDTFLEGVVVEFKIIQLDMAAEIFIATNKIPTNDWIEKYIRRGLKEVL